MAVEVLLVFLNFSLDLRSSLVVPVELELEEEELLLEENDIVMMENLWTTKKTLTWT